MNPDELASLLEEAAEQLRRRGKDAIETSKTTGRTHGSPAATAPREMAKLLVKFAKLTRVDKKIWIDFISFFGLPIDVKPRESSRRSLERILSFIDKNPDFARSPVPPRSDGRASAELSRALKFLLEDD